MRLRQRLVPIFALWVALAPAAGCRHESGPPAVTPAPAPPQPRPPSAVTSQVGEGPIPVFGASVYAPGQEIYKQLRQEDSLMAFLTCQGEPDRLEVIDNPGAPPRIILEYSRASLAKRGTVEIAPSAAGYYAAQPIDPSGTLKSSVAKNPPRHGEPAAKPKPASAAKPRAATPAPGGEPDPGEPAGDREPPPRPALPQPSPTQLDECPIEPWRADCRDLCSPGAKWEWCSYRN